MNQTNHELIPEKDCTPKCHSHIHAQQILSCVTKATASEIRAYCLWLCYNFPTITDESGRNLLHLASSCGKWEVVEWLLEHCHCEVDIRDSESGWTALHRSLFYGHLIAAQMLLSHGANLRMTDHDGFTPLDIVVKDRLPYIEYIPTNPLEVYVWGSNTNYNLGLGNEQSRANPEILDTFRRDSVIIKQVVICKFHSVFLSNDGRLFTCGHGHGGRLGQGSEDTGLVPASVRGLGPTRCELVASGQDHLVLLMDGGQVWTCGLNTYHQLGHCPPPERLVTPKPLSLKFLKGNEVVGVCAARFHSVIYTKDAVYTFGLNAGQLGHPKGDRTQILPRQVSAVYNKEWEISHVAASDGATVCATNRGDVYVLHEYQHRKIASRQLEIQKLSVVGGHLDSRCDVAGVREGGGLELRVILLTKSGKVFLWRQSNPFLRRCLFTSGRQLLVSDIHLNHYTVAMVTHDNEGFLGHILPFKEKKNANIGSLSSSPPSSKIQNTYGQLNVLLDREDCDLIRAKRIPHIHRATGITCDSKGRNFAVLQSSPKMGLIDLPIISTSEMQQHMLTLMEEAQENDIIHDIVVKVGQKEYFSHKYILASRSDYFRKQIMSGNYSPGKKIIIENVQPEAFEQVLKFIYCNTCDFLVDGYEVKGKTTEVLESFDSTDINLKSAEIYQADFHKISAYKVLQEKKQNKHGTGAKLKDKSKKNIYCDPLRAVQEASRRLNVPVLSKRLDEVQLVNGKVKLNCTSYFPKLLFDRNKLQDLCDVTLCAKDGTEFPCHRCILAARLEYFHSMLGSCWIETSSAESLPLPVSSKVLDIVLDYLYTDDAPEVFASEDPEFLCHILVVADQLLISRLKEICEMGLVDLITLKNASELLEFSFLYNAVQLKKTCMQYICINLPAIFEARCLDVLSSEALEELSSFYRNMVPSMSRRFITPNPGIPTAEELEAIERNFPVSKDCDIMKYRADSISTKSHESKGKGRRRTHSQRGESKETLLSCVQRSDSVSSETDIILDIDLSVKEDELNKAQTEINITFKEEKSNFLSTGNNLNGPVSNKVLTPEKMPGKWHISQKVDDTPRLDEIMMEEKKWKKSPKSPSFHGESKRVAHMSQKQKKMLAVTQSAVVKDLTDKIVAPLPSVANQLNKNAPCPWAKKNPSPLQSQSFWDVVASRDSKPTLETSPSSNSIQSLPTSPSLSDDSKISCTVNPWIKNQSVIQEDQPLVVSLEAIQRAEEEKLQNAVKPYIKSLHLINLEDQAIEELLVLYKAVDNPNEKITVTRILPEKMATPVWKKHV